MRYIKIFGWFLLTMLIPFPLWMFIAWHLTPARQFPIVIIDKTVLTSEGKEHESLNWILTNEKFAKSNGELYSIEKDYYGFFPKKNKKFSLHGLENFTPQQIDSLASASKAVYVTDTYGIFSNEWYSQKVQTEQSNLIYGGMSSADLKFLQKMKEKKKLILTEFNSIASPTPDSIRAGFEAMFGLRWTGWTGKYFESLDTLSNKELPHWLIRDYKMQHHNLWSFKNSGIAFVHYDGRVEILENKTHLIKEIPYLLTNRENRERFNLPAKVKYPYWFDVMFTKHSNTVPSVYSIYTNTKGDSLLRLNGIPKIFPAIIEHTGDYNFYYFAGDFCDNPVEQFAAKLKGIRLFKWLFYDSKEISERRSFFWEYYAPLITKILNNFYDAHH
ncbi:MAG: hypothetical protein WCS69_03080 [Ignavibacteriaceae bacterium]|jgi:hypothetical protein